MMSTQENSKIFIIMFYGIVIPMSNLFLKLYA